MAAASEQTPPYFVPKDTVYQKWVRRPDGVLGIAIDLRSVKVEGVVYTPVHLIVTPEAFGSVMMGKGLPRSGILFEEPLKVTAP